MSTVRLLLRVAESGHPQCHTLMERLRPFLGHRPKAGLAASRTTGHRHNTLALCLSPLRRRRHSGRHAKLADRGRDDDRRHARPCRRLQYADHLPLYRPVPDLWAAWRGSGPLHTGKLVWDSSRSSGPSCRSDVGPTETIRRLFMDETRARSSIPRKKRLSLGVGPR